MQLCSTYRTSRECDIVLGKTLDVWSCLNPNNPKNIVRKVLENN